MSKFRYYITDLYDGCIRGTDNADHAKLYAESEDFFVVDTDTGEWLLAGGDAEDITQICNPTGD